MEDGRSFRGVNLSTEAGRRVEPVALARSEQVVLYDATRLVVRVEAPIIQLRPSVLVTPGDGTGGRN